MQVNKFCYVFLLIVTAVTYAASFARAQTPPSGPLSPPAGETVLQPKGGCADLRSLTGYEFTVETAVLIPPESGVPEHCRIRGQILPEIRFEVNLPTSWNRRFYMYGNGGYAGESLDGPQRAGSRARAMQLGFASAATNTGHEASSEPLATFAQNRQKLLDYAFRSLHTTAESAKRLIEAYYGVKP
ncbi:MAG: tannase/feruloyl esterase family alpha/beta hydrolase, partial [Acidobacteria bacterium]|nr:tannase/feruloyl esterase family alpha/beta hydrolase [Acidobacteriota bacterium]